MYCVVIKNSKSRISYFPTMDEKIRILDTDDCVVEEYSFREIREMSLLIDIGGLDAWQISYPRIMKLLKGKIRVYYASEKWRMSFNNKQHIVIYDNHNGYIDLVHESKSLICSLVSVADAVIVDVAIEYAEKFGRYYMIWLRIMIRAHSLDNLTGEAVVKMLWDENGLNCVYGVENHRGVMSSMCITDSWKPSGDIEARLRLAGEVS